jgi:hypothetical protein
LSAKWVRIAQRGNPTVPIPPAMAAAPGRAAPPLGRPGIGIVAVVQNHPLPIANQRFHRVVIRTALGQTRPGPLPLAPGLSRGARWARMRSVLSPPHPDLLFRIPAPELPQKANRNESTLARQKRPAPPLAVDLVNGKPREPAAPLLLPGPSPARGRRRAAAALGFAIDRLAIKKQQHALIGPVLPELTDAAPVLAAESPDQFPSPPLVAPLGQRAAAPGPAEFGRGGLGPAPDLTPLLDRAARRRPPRPPPLDAGQTVRRKGRPVGLAGVGVSPPRREQGRGPRGPPPPAAKPQPVGAAQRPKHSPGPVPGGATAAA